jgi:hypothetical protein
MADQPPGHGERFLPDRRLTILFAGARKASERDRAYERLRKVLIASENA